MSSASPRLARREQLLEAARRRLRRIEIEQHRVKAFLARLEADYEDDVADHLSRKLRRRTTPVADKAEDVKPSKAVAAVSDSAIMSVLPFAAPAREKTVSPRIEPAADTRRGRKRDDVIVAKIPRAALPAQQAKADTAPFRVSPTDKDNPRRPARIHKAASPVMVSAVIHAAALFFCLTVTFATVVQQGIPLFASPTDFVDEAPAEFSEVEVTTHKFDDSVLQNTFVESDDLNITDNAIHELEPATLGAGSQALGDIGQLDALPGDLGTLMAGAGSPGSGKPGGPLGDAVFFGARSKGDRFVFVVDNSSSMKGGRLDAAVAEINRTVEALSPKQAFYVIFVSDKTYPMFFPQREPNLVPATAANKKRLAAWLPNAILASGNNRKLIEAMDMAAALRPHAVFLLWDGDMKYSEKVRLEVMTHLTQPNDWRFAIHTLGMGISSLDSQQNLTMIAEAHGGTFRRVDVPTVRPR